MYRQGVEEGVEPGGDFAVGELSDVARDDGDLVGVESLFKRYPPFFRESDSTLDKRKSRTRRTTIACVEEPLQLAPALVEIQSMSGFSSGGPHAS